MRKQNRYTDAIAKLDEAEKISPKNSLIFTMRGDVYLAPRRRDFDLAKEQFTKAKELDLSQKAIGELVTSFLGVDLKQVESNKAAELAKLGITPIWFEKGRYELVENLLCLAKKAAVVPERYSQREIKNIPALPIPEVHHRADEVAKQLRLLDAAVQELNWQIDLR